MKKRTLVLREVTTKEVRLTAHEYNRAKGLKGAELKTLAQIKAEIDADQAVFKTIFGGGKAKPINPATIVTIREYAQDGANPEWEKVA